jgi:hypothetical protein
MAKGVRLSAYQSSNLMKIAAGHSIGIERVIGTFPNATFKPKCVFAANAAHPGELGSRRDPARRLDQIGEILRYHAEWDQ